MQHLPKKLKKDAIAEAIFEMRFICNDLPELVVGRLADNPDWRPFTKGRLPFSDIPSPIRLQDPTLRYQPTIELRDLDRPRIVKIGTNVISYHVLAPYCGWEQFSGELETLLDFLFNQLECVQCERFGFRYVNILNHSDHFIANISQLNQKIEIRGEALSVPLNLNYVRNYDQYHSVMIKIASPEFVAGQLPPATSALIDVDVFTPDPIQNSDSDFAKAWLFKAHDYEKIEFFKLIPDKVIKQLEEDQGAS